MEPHYEIAGSRPDGTKFALAGGEATFLADRLGSGLTPAEALLDFGDAVEAASTGAGPVPAGDWLIFDDHARAVEYLDALPLSVRAAFALRVESGY